MKKILIISLIVNLALIIFAGYLMFDLGIWKTASQINSLVNQTNLNNTQIQQIVNWINQTISASQVKK